MANENIDPNELISCALSLKDRLCGSEFPTHILPQKMQEIVRHTNECLGYPIDFIASAMCFAASVAIGNTHIVRFKEGWSEKAILYLAIVGKAGTNKSHPLSFAMRPLLEYDARENLAFTKLKEEYNRISTLSKKEREEEGVGEFPKPPTQKKFVVSDTTPEGLSEVLNVNKRGICLYADELKSWINNFNRYTKGSEEQLWLSIFSGKPIIIDRRGSDSISIRHTFVGVIGSIQHGLLKDLSNGERSDNGFLDRILFVLPKDLTKKYWNTIDLPHHITPMWSAVMQQIIGLGLALDDNGEPVPIEVPFESAAKRRLYEWQRYNTDLCNGESNERLIGAYSKLEIYVIRISLIIQIIRWACGEAEKECIDIRSVENAIEVVEYFRRSNQYMQKILDTTKTLEQLTTDKLTLFSRLPNDFSTQEGTKIAADLNMSPQSFKRFLAEVKNTLLDNYKHGCYKKLI